MNFNLLLKFQAMGRRYILTGLLRTESQPLGPGRHLPVSVRSQAFLGKAARQAATQERPDGSGAVGIRAPELVGDLLVSGLCHRVAQQRPAFVRQCVQSLWIIADHVVDVIRVFVLAAALECVPFQSQKRWNTHHVQACRVRPPFRRPSPQDVLNVVIQGQLTSLNLLDPQFFNPLKTC